MEWPNWLKLIICEKELTDKDIYYSNWQKEKDDNDKCGENILKLEKELKAKLDIIQKLDDGWDNPYAWPSHDSNYETIDGLRIPENTFIQFNDREIKQAVIGLKRRDAYETLKSVIKYVAQRIAYYDENKNPIHPDYKEFFQNPSMTWHGRKADCEDMANLTAGIMGMLGYKSEVVCCKAEVEWGDQKIGHAWNKLIIDGVEYDFDANAKQNPGLVVKYPKLKDCWDFYNHYGVYKL